jgi:hypothetical protein
LPVSSEYEGCPDHRAVEFLVVPATEPGPTRAGDNIQTHDKATSAVRVPAFAGTTKSVLATAFCPRFPFRSRPLKTEGARDPQERARGRPGARCTRGLVCGEAQKKLHTSIQVKRRHPAFPARWLDGLYVLSPVNGLFCHRRPREALAPRELDASVAASGPHDFAVRAGTTRQLVPSRPSHPGPRFVTNAHTPLRWARTRILCR